MVTDKPTTGGNEGPNPARDRWVKAIKAEEQDPGSTLEFYEKKEERLEEALRNLGYQGDMTEDDLRAFLKDNTISGEQRGIANVTVNNLRHIKRFQTDSSNQETSHEVDNADAKPDWEKAERENPIPEGATYLKGVDLLLNPEDPNTPFDERVKNLEDYVDGLTNLANDGKSDISRLRRGLQGQEGSHTDGLPTTEAKLDQLKEAYYTEGRITDSTVRDQAEKVIEFWQDKKTLSEGLKSGKIFQDILKIRRDDLEAEKQELAKYGDDYIPNTNQSISDEDLEQILIDDNASDEAKEKAYRISLQRKIATDQFAIADIIDYCKDKYPNLDLERYQSVDDDLEVNPIQDARADDDQDDNPDGDPDGGQDNGHDSELPATREEIEELYVKLLDAKAELEAKLAELRALLGIKDNPDDGLDDGGNDDPGDGSDEGPDNGQDDGGDDGGNDGGDLDHDDDDNDNDDNHDKPRPRIIAAQLDMEQEVLDWADSQAEEMLAADNAKSNIITKIFKGGLFKRFFQVRYKRDLLEGKKLMTDQNGRQMTLREYVISTQGAAQAARIASTLADPSLRHKGEQVEINQAETARMRSAIQAYEDAAKSGADGATRLNAFRQRIAYERHLAEQNGEQLSADFDNSIAIAEAALQGAEHYGGIEAIKQGFMVVNAKTTSGLQGKAHLTRGEQWIKNFEEKGQYGVAQLVALGINVGSSIFTTGARAAFGVFGGIGVSGLLARAKARTEAAQNRASVMLNVVSGRQQVYASTPPDQLKGRAAKNAAKREQELLDTTYDVVRASDMTASFNAAIESGDEGTLISLLGEYDARREMMNLQDIDLFGYNSRETVADEELAMMLAASNARAALAKKEHGLEKLEVVKNVFHEDLVKHVQAQDEKFEKVQNQRGRAALFKAVGLGTLTALGGPEIWSLIDKKSTGAAEILLGLNKYDDPGARRTLLAQLAYGPNTFVSAQVSNLDPTKPQDQARIDELKKQGYVESTGPTRKIPTTRTENVPLADANGRTNVDITYLDNDTPQIDGNEKLLLGHGEHGLTAAAHGTSTFNGVSYNFDDYVKQDNIYLLINRNGNQFFSPVDHFNQAGQPVFGDANGVYKIVGGGSIKIGSGFDTASVVAIDPTTPIGSGKVHAFSFDTEIGDHNFFGDVQQIVPDVDVKPGLSTMTQYATSDVVVGPGIPYLQNDNVGPSEQTVQTPPVIFRQPGQDGGQQPGQGGQPTGGGQQPGTPQQPGQPGQSGTGPTGGQQETPRPGVQDSHIPSGPDEDRPTSAQGGQPTDQNGSPQPIDIEPSDDTSTGEPEPDMSDIDAEGEANIENLNNMVRSNSNLLGNDGVNLILNNGTPQGDAATNADDSANQDPEEAFNIWYSRLSNDGKDVVRSIARTIMSNGPAVANSVNEIFYNWCRHYHVGQDGESVPNAA